MKALLLMVGLAFAAPAPKLDLPESEAAEEPKVVFSKDARKFHEPKCRWARRCKKNCVTIPLSEAQKRGAPCKLCNGGLPDKPGDK